MKLKASIVVLDAARANPFARSGAPLAGGLALIEPEPGVMLAFNSAPGTVAPEGQGPYGPYAQALAEMIREGGLPLTDVFERTRLRVNDMTKGAEVPWHATKIPASLVFFERAADAPPPAISTEQTAAIRARPIRDLDAQEAYIVALERDTLEGYSDFLAVYPNDPMARRVRAIIAARREAITWRRTRVVDTPPAYWSYLRRYPDGPHAGDARRRLAFLAAAFEPPPSFAVMAYDCHRRRRRRSFIFGGRFLCSTIRHLASHHHRPRRSSSWRHRHPNSWCWHRHLHRWEFSCCRCRYTGPFRFGCVRRIRGSAAEQRDLPQRPQHGRHQQCDEHRDYHQSERPDADHSPPAAQAAAQPQGAPGGRPAAPAALGPALPPSVAQKAAILQSQSPQGPGAPAATAPASTTPSATVAPGTPTSTSTLGGAKPGTAPARAPAATAPASTTPSAAVTPGAPTPTPGAKPGTAPARAPAAKAPASTTPSAAVTPGTPTPDADWGRSKLERGPRKRRLHGAGANSAFGRGHAGGTNTDAWRPLQAWNAAIASAAGCKAGAILIAIVRDNAGDAIDALSCDDARDAQGQCQPAGATAARARSKAGDAATSCGRHKADCAIAARG